MLPLQFFGQNLHFAIDLFASLVCFSVFWLYFDAWLAKRQLKELVKWLGFLLLSLSFFIHSTIIEQSVLGTSLLGEWTDVLSTLLRIFGYLGIIWAQIIDPLQERPKTSGLDLAVSSGTTLKDAKNQSVLSGLPLIGNLILPLAAGVASFLYFRRATKGLEKHLLWIGASFFLLAGFEILALASLLRTSNNVLIYNATSAFGPVWIVEHVVLLAAMVLLGKWVWGYLVTRLQSQLFIISTSIILTVYLVVTVSFTFLLIRDVQRGALKNLETSAKVLDYALDAKKAQVSALSESLSQSREITDGLSAKNRRKLAVTLTKTLTSKQISSLVITNENGQVLLRAEDPDRFGDSISEDPLVKRALIGLPSSSLTTSEAVLAPNLLIQSASTLRNSKKQIIGTLTVGLTVDNAFVDGIKAATGLEAAVYAGNTRSSTTFVAPDGRSRWVGIKEESSAVKNSVLDKGKPFIGSVEIINRPFLAVYAPILDVDNVPIGMLFIGEPQVVILQAAGRSIEITFLVTAALLLASIVPSYFISKYLTSQLS